MSLTSTDRILPFKASFDATCDHPPGQDPRSIMNELLFKNLNFLFISISLKADLDLYPCIFDFLKY